MTGTRPLRADAARNRKLLLAAAADEFAERGLDASVADIARRAGVGKGTVFRHFATKDELIAAILIDRMEALSELGERLIGTEDADAALREFLTAAAMQRQERDLSFLAAASESMVEVSRARERMLTAVDALVDKARRHGVVRDDVTGTDVFLLMCAPNYVAGYVPNASPDLWRRYLALILDGLRPEGARPLPESAPDFGLPKACRPNFKRSATVKWEIGPRWRDRGRVVPADGSGGQRGSGESSPGARGRGRAVNLSCFNRAAMKRWAVVRGCVAGAGR